MDNLQTNLNGNTPALAPAGGPVNHVPYNAMDSRKIQQDVGAVKQEQLRKIEVGSGVEGPKILNNGKSLDEMAKIYAGMVMSNKKWSWNKDVENGKSLSIKEKKLIKEKAIVMNAIPKVEVKRVHGMKFGFADFKSAGLVLETKYLPEKLWKTSDVEQFNWLDSAVGGRIAGTTWHHSEIPGEMQLVETGIHDIIPHNGGRTKGMWADAPR